VIAVALAAHTIIERETISASPTGAEYVWERGSVRKAGDAEPLRRNDFLLLQ
jgi:hypothetical protein